MSDALYLAWRYLASHRLKTAVLVASIALTTLIPLTLMLLVRQSAEAIGARAERTPLVLGAKGSPLELTLSTLYFTTDVQETVPARLADEINASGLAQAIPVHAMFRAGGAPVIGTSVEYLELRQLEVSEGRVFARLGECVVGATAAQRLAVGPGDALMTESENAFDLAGTYPLRMQVTGVLAPSGSADDDAVIADVTTAWIAAGLAHGHDDLADPASRSGVLRREGDVITANASVVMYNEVTEANIDSYHFHGDTADFPLTAVIAVPPDRKGRSLLLGRYGTPTSSWLIVEPEEVLADLMATVFTVERYVVAALIVVALATAAVMVLVFDLSRRLRRGEMETMFKIGASRARIVSVLAMEVVLVLVLGAGLGSGLAFAVGAFGPAFTRLLVSA